MTAAITETLDIVAPRSNRPYLTAVPDCEPPFDDDLPQARARTSTPVVDAANSPGGPVDMTENAGPQGALGLVAPPVAAPVNAAARALARGLVEALTGSRPPRQLAGVCTPQVFQTLTQHRRPSVFVTRMISVRATQPADGVAEVTVVFRRDARVSAMAFRMVGGPRQWRVAALELA